MYEGIGRYDGKNGAQQKEVLFSHYTNLQFDTTKPPGMIASLAIANPTSTSDFNNVYALGLGINTNDIYESFFADIYQDAGESWNNEVRLLPSFHRPPPTHLLTITTCACCFAARSSICTSSPGTGQGSTATRPPAFYATAMELAPMVGLTTTFSPASATTTGRAQGAITALLTSPHHPALPATGTTS